MARPAPTSLYDRTLQALLDRTLCPACTTTLPGPRCPACGLDVTAPGAGLVWQESVTVADALRRRAQHIDAMRAATARVAPGRAAPAPAQGRAPAPGVVGVVAPPVGPPLVAGPTVGPPPVGAPPVAPPPVAAPSTTAPGAPPARPVPAAVVTARPKGTAARPRTPWRVQTVLQVVGATLLVAACVAFLVFAWDVLTLGARATAVGTATLVVFALATLLRGRGLPQGAEAVGGLAAALLLLDAWALRATGAVVVGAGPGQATTSLALCAAVLGCWGVAGRVRAGTVAAAALLPVVPLVWLPHAGSPESAALLPVVPLVWLPHAGSPESAALLLVGAAALTLVRAAAGPGRRAERRVLQVAAWATAACGTAVAGVTVLVRAGLDGPAWSAAGVLAAASVVLALQARVEEGALAAASGPPGPRPGGRRTAGAAWWASAGATVAVAVGAVAAATARAAGADGAASWHAAALATVVASLLLHRSAVPPVPRPVATAVGVVAGSAAAGTAAWLALVSLAHLVAPGATTPPVPVVTTLSGAAALAATSLLADRLAAGGDGGRVRALGAVRGGAAVLASVATPLLVVPGVAAGPAGRSALTVAGLAVVSAAWVVVRSAAVRWRTTGAAGEAAAASAAVLAATASPAATGAALLLAASVAVHARTWGRRGAADAASTAVAAVLVVAAGVAAAVALGLQPTAGAVVATAVTAAALLVRAARHSVAAAERGTALGVVAPLVLVAWTAAAAADPGPGAWRLVAPSLAVAPGLALVAALLRDLAGVGRGSVVAGALAGAPVAAAAVATVHGALGRPVPAGAALLVVALGAASVLASHLTTAGGGSSARVAAEAAGWSVVGCGTLACAAVGPTPTVAALAAAAATAGGWAVHRDRRSAWWAAWALGSAAWAVALAAGAVVLVEPYLVPPGLALVAVGAARLRRGAPGAASLVAGGTALVTLPTALLPAVLPLGDRWVDRAAVTVAFTAAALAAAARLGRGPQGPDGERRRTAAVLALAAAVLALLGPARRALLVAGGGVPGPERLPHVVEPWALTAGLLVVGAALVAHRTWPTRLAVGVRAVAPWLVLAVVTLPVLLTVALGTTGGTPATAARLAVLGALGVAAAVAPAASERRTARGDGSAGAGGRAPRVTDLGLVLVASVALVAPAVLPDTLRDAPSGALALLAATVTVLVVRRSGTAPAPWLAVAVLALVPTLAARGGAVRPAAWVLAAVLLLGLAHAARAAARATSPATAAPAPTATTARVSPRTVVRALAASAGVLALLGPWVDAVTDAVAPAARGPLAVELPAVAGAALVAAGWAVAGPRPRRRHDGGAEGTSAARAWPTPPVPGAAALALAVLAVPVLLAVDGTALGAARAAVVLAAAGVLAWRDRVAGDATAGTAVAVLAAVSAALRDGPEPAEVPLVVAGLLTVALGARRLIRVESAGSWSALGVPLAVTLGVPVLALLALPTPARAVTALLLALGATVVGAVRRLQAPLLLGAAASLTGAGTLLSPVAAGALARVDGWVLLALGGAAVLGLGITYERRVREAREAVRVVAAMR